MDRHLLVPIDGSAQSTKALDHALDLYPEATITLLHVVNPVNAYSYGDADYFDFDGYQEQAAAMHERGEAILEEARETAASRGVEVETILETGHPADRILETVESEGVDHVVMGSRGRSGVGRILFGSVAETVTRRAGVPVTIVR